MPAEEKPLRADAERNRRRLLDAAEALFARARASTSASARSPQRAGVGRGTLFRNFPTKEDLIAAIVVDRMSEATARGRELLERRDPGDGAVRASSTRSSGASSSTAACSRRCRQVPGQSRRSAPPTPRSSACLDGAAHPRPGRRRRALRRRRDGRADAGQGRVRGRERVLARSTPSIAERHLDLVRAALSAPAPTSSRCAAAPRRSSDIERVSGPEDEAAQAEDGPAAAGSPARSGPETERRRGPSCLRR